MTLSERETRMLRELALKHGCSFGGIKPLREAMAALSELLLAAKEKAKRIAHNHESANRDGSAYSEGYDAAASMIAADLDQPWGDLFEEKV